MLVNTLARDKKQQNKKIDIMQNCKVFVSKIAKKGTRPWSFPILLLKAEFKSFTSTASLKRETT